jgi:ADP-ribose pyrophosphatase
MTREYPIAPIVGVGAVIVRDNRVLLVRRGNEPNRGLWSIPGGAVELGETLAQAATREVREECRLEIKAQGVLSTFELIQRDEQDKVRYHYVLIDLAARYVGGQTTAGTDALDAHWATEDELDTLDIVPRLLPLLHAALQEASRSQQGTSPEDRPESPGDA